MRCYSKNVYPYEVLKYAADAYKNLCDIIINEKETYWSVDFLNCKESEELIIKEFTNFLIEIINGVDV